MAPVRVSEQQPSRPVEKEHGGKRADHFVQQATSGRGQEPEHGDEGECLSSPGKRASIQGFASSQADFRGLIPSWKPDSFRLCRPPGIARPVSTNGFASTMEEFRDCWLNARNIRGHCKRKL
jgi:hypothetical protein